MGTGTALLLFWGLIFVVWGLGPIIVVAITDFDESCEEENRKREEEEIKAYIRTNNERRGIKIK